jgi:hypothetical protein
MRHLLAVSAASLLLCAAAAAQPATPEPETERGDCFRNESVAGWGLIDSRTVRVRIDSNRSYALTTNRNARALRWETGIVLTSPSGWICTGAERGVQIHTRGEIPQTYVVDAVARLPRAEDETAQD